MRLFYLVRLLHLVDDPVIANEVYLDGIVNIDLLLFPFVGRLMDQFAEVDGVARLFHLNIFGKIPELLFTKEVVVYLGAGETDICLFCSVHYLFATN